MKFEMVRDLDLPVVYDSLPEPPPLSMDEYFESIQFWCKYFYNREADEAWRKISVVNAKFEIRD